MTEPAIGKTHTLIERLTQAGDGSIHRELLIEARNALDQATADRDEAQEAAYRRTSQLRDAEDRIEQLENLKWYEGLVYRFVDRMNDPAECDLLHDIVAEFVDEVRKKVRVCQGHTKS